VVRDEIPEAYRQHLTQPFARLDLAPAASGFVGKFQHPTRCGHSTIKWWVGGAANTRAHTKRPSIHGSTQRHTVRFNRRAYYQCPSCMHLPAFCLGALAHSEPHMTYQPIDDRVCFQQHFSCAHFLPSQPTSIETSLHPWYSHNANHSLSHTTR
jgi:hypothetical protein